MTTKLPMDDTDAMIVAIIAVEEFAALPLKACTPEARAVAVLLFSGIMGRVIDKIPRTAATEHMFTLFEESASLADHARELLHLSHEQHFPNLTQRKQ